MIDDTERLWDQSYVGIQQHFDLMVRLELKAIAERFSAQEKALYLAREEAQRQYDHLNALRRQVEEDRSAFVLNAVQQVKDAEMDRRLSSLERSLSWGLGALAVLVIILQFVMPHLLGGK